VDRTENRNKQLLYFGRDKLFVKQKKRGVTEKLLLLFNKTL